MKQPEIGYTEPAGHEVIFIIKANYYFMNGNQAWDRVQHLCYHLKEAMELADKVQAAIVDENSSEEEIAKSIKLVKHYRWGEYTNMFITGYVGVFEMTRKRVY